MARRAAIPAGLLLALSVAGLAACSPAGNELTSDRVQESTRPAIAPGDFVLLPCKAETDRPCAFVMAGGKRLMFGAPAGAANGLGPEDRASLDALMLFSLHPEDVAGADELRYYGWRAGRGDALPVTGPQGTGSFVEGLNLAYEQPDAISFVEDGAPSGGYVAALLSVASDVREDALVYDSGDLKVRAMTGQASGLAYRVGYRDIDETWHEALLVPCSSSADMQPGSYPGTLENTVTVGCGGDGELAAVWPLDAALFVEKSSG
ncbi:hypothetical protein [Henriciella sp.]|uniref:hypothetical protein n=1 Tax=Henriciella sp. TaxID=1968823 RepID=UPI00260D28EA|nr:hypothetical protein [Henriciella sp.]